MCTNVNDLKVEKVCGHLLATNQIGSLGKTKKVWKYMEPSTVISLLFEFSDIPRLLCLLCFVWHQVFNYVSCDVLIFMSCSFSSTSVFSLSSSFSLSHNLSDDACSPLSVMATV